jgi:hypothetical protein
MEAYSAPVGYVFSLNAGGRSGTFDVVAGDFSTELAADTENGIYVGQADDPTALTKVARRRIESTINITWFGAVGDGTTDDTLAIQAACVYADSLVGFRLDFDQGSYKITVSSVLWPLEPTPLYTFSGKSGISFVFNGAEFIDSTIYAHTEIGRLFRFENCEDIEFIGELKVTGSRTSTTAGDNRGMQIIVMSGCDGFDGAVRSDGNSAVFKSYASLIYNYNIKLRSWSKNTHYGCAAFNLENADVSVYAEGSYRPCFISGCGNSNFNVISKEQVGTFLLKAYSGTPLTENVNINFVWSDPVSASAYPIAIEVESDDPIVIRNVNINLSIINIGVTPVTTRLFGLQNRVPSNGGFKTSPTGHLLENIKISGYMDTGSNCDKITLPQNGTFPAGDIVRNLVIDGLTADGSGDITSDIDLEGVTTWNKIINQDGLTRFRGLSGLNSRAVIQNSLIQAYESSKTDTTPVSFINTLITDYDATKLPITNKIFSNCVIDDSNVNMSYFNESQIFTKSYIGDLTGTQSIFKFVGPVRALGILDYVLVSDNEEPTANQTHGKLRFFIYNTPSGTSSLHNIASTDVTSIGTASVLTVSGLSGTGEGFLQFSATNYNTSAAYAVFKLTIIPQNKIGNRFLAYQA